MGDKGKEIVRMNVDELINKLSRAFADEWLAYYQYWVGAKVVKGVMKEAAVAELTQHAADELRHAEILAGRIMQLGGTPILRPEEWYKMTNCGYSAPEDPSVGAILEQNVKGERCAIDVYNRLLEATKDKDLVTYNIALQILQDEVEHEEDLQVLSEDLEEMKRR